MDDESNPDTKSLVSARQGEAREARRGEATHQDTELECHSQHATRNGDALLSMWKYICMYVCMYI